jgi:hypothetical protein
MGKKTRSLAGDVSICDQSNLLEVAMTKRDTEIFEAVSALRAALDNTSDAVDSLLPCISSKTARHRGKLTQRVVINGANKSRPTSLAEELRDIVIRMRLIESSVIHVTTSSKSGVARCVKPIPPRAAS